MEVEGIITWGGSVILKPSCMSGVTRRDVKTPKPSLLSQSLGVDPGIGHFQSFFEESDVQPELRTSGTAASGKAPQRRWVL